MEISANITGFFGWVGIAALVVAGVAVALFIAAIAAAAVSGGGRRPFAPRPTLLLLEMFFTPLKRILPALTRKKFAAEKLGIGLYNTLGLAEYSATPLADRAVFLPQCLRYNDCPARLSSEEGFECKACGKCVIGEIRAIAPEVPVFISPGGSFARRLLLKHRPKAVLGVACPPDLFEGLQSAFHGGIPAQGVALTRVGCVNTDVRLDEVREKLLLGTEIPEAKP